MTINFLFMLKAYLLVFSVLVLAGAGCTASSGADVNGNGLQVDGGIDVGGDRNGN